MRNNIKLKYKIIVFVIIAFLQAGLFNTIISFSEENQETTQARTSQTIADGTYVIRSAINEKFVLDVLGASQDNGANVQLYEYSADNQKKFKVTHLGNGYYSIVAVHSNKALDVKDASKEKGANVWQYEQNGTDAQKWMIKDAGNGYYSIISKCNGLYVDVLDAKASNYTNIQMCDGNGLNAQKFKFEKVTNESQGGNNNQGSSNSPVVGTQTIANGTYVIRSSIDEKFVLDVLGASQENGANVQLYEYTADDQKRFKVTYLGDGYYSIIALHSSKSLAVEGASQEKGANVYQWEYSGSDAQKWVIKEAGNGYYSIISKCNGLYIDVLNASASNYTNIQMCDGNGLNAQKFKFEKVADGNQGGNTPPVVGTQTIADGTYVIRSSIDEKFVLDVLGASQENGANVQLYEYTADDQKRFKVTYLGDGYYSIIALHSSKSLAVEGASQEKGANVCQWEYSGSDAQKWVIKEAGNGYYSMVSKCNGLYVDVLNASASNYTNIQMCDGNGLNAQKFKFEKVTDENQGGDDNQGGNEPGDDNTIQGEKTIEDGTYVISSALNSKFVLDVLGGSQDNGANVQLYEYSAVAQKRFKVTYLGDGYYSIIAVHSNKSLDVKDASQEKGANVWQWEQNGTDAQKWVIKEAGNGYYNIISKCNGLYMDVLNANASNSTNIQMCDGNGLDAQKFRFESLSINIDTAKYPGYKERIEALMEKHPSWNFELLYTGLKFDEVIAGEHAVHARNLVPSSYGGEWICPVCGTKLYDSGWYCASEKAIANYMDPRNFLDETNVFQFQDLNEYINGVCSLEGIQSQINGTFLQNYANAIDNACKNQNVNSYYIITRIIQEQGRNGTTIGKGMDGGDGKTYYNPFNIGASGDGYDQIYANALARAKKEGWDTMQKAIEGGITFCKQNWLENYQNTLYQNKFDIDTRNGTSLYTHQYMQNLMAAYSEARLMRGMYADTNKLDSNFTFIIPVYEEMSSTLSPVPSDNQETAPINVQITANGGLWLRKEANTSSETLRLIPQGETILSVQRGINSDWQKVITTDGVIGYMSGTYLKQVDDVTNCNYIARVKTSDGSGCYIRVGPSIQLDRITALTEGTSVTVINEGTYNHIDGYDWCRIQLSDGRQAFMPSRYLVRN